MKLVWDAVGEKKFETGVDHGVLYPFNDMGTDYDKGVAWNGLTGLTESPSGAEETAFYADNIKYGVLRSAEDFGGTVEAYYYPAEFKLCDGTATLTKGVYVHQQNRRPFGLCYRTAIGSDTSTDYDKNYKLHLVYGATVSPSEKAYSTINENPDAITFSWEFTTVPVNVTGHKPTALLTIDSTEVDSLKLAELEKILYGDAEEEPRLPLPDEVYSIFND